MLWSGLKPGHRHTLFRGRSRLMECLGAIPAVRLETLWLHPLSKYNVTYRRLAESIKRDGGPTSFSCSTYCTYYCTIFVWHDLLSMQFHWLVMKSHRTINSCWSFVWYSLWMGIGNEERAKAQDYAQVSEWQYSNTRWTVNSTNRVWSGIYFRRK